MTQTFYAVIIKKNATDFLKLRRVTKFDKLYQWLDKHEPNWRWGNVYYRRKQIGSFTNKIRPKHFDI